MIPKLDLKKMAVWDFVRFMKLGFTPIMMMHGAADCTLIVLGVFRMMHFADDAFLMRIHTWCPKKRVLSELLDLALIMGACLNPLC